jgi:hypothetical protein
MKTKVSLPEIDMQATETIGANGGKEVVTVEVNKRIPTACENNLSRHFVRVGTLKNRRSRSEI